MTTEVLVDYEYELIGICINNGYEEGCEDNVWNVCEEVQGDESEPEFLCDADGIPMGTSIEEIRKREAIIADFLSKWREANVDGKILNDALNDYIYFRNISFTEAKEHSSKSYGRFYKLRLIISGKVTMFRPFLILLLHLAGCQSVT